MRFPFVAIAGLVGLVCGCGSAPEGASVSRLSGTIDGGMTLSGVVTLADNTVIPRGVTVILTAGTTVHAEPAKGLEVRGTLDVRGTKGTPVRFDSTSDAGVWSGLTVAGGSATLRNVEFRDCGTAFTAQEGSHYDIQGISVADCNAALSLASTGSVRYGTLHGRGAAHQSTPVRLTNCSATLSDLLIDNVNSGVDMVVVSGGSPRFDHLEIAQSHCGMHFGSGSNIAITNSIIHANAYMLMLNGATNTAVTGNNLFGNSVNVGSCGIGSVAASGNFVVGSLYDGTCAGQAANLKPATAWLTTAGPRPQP